MAYENFPYVIVAVPVVFLILMFFLPETPYALLKDNKVEVCPIQTHVKVIVIRLTFFSILKIFS